ncbi:MAG TPA: hypothetical protein VFA98_09365 [Thermoanaerobaculia bacterium]|nr:hypothetical protein [Thermoanaerobaculia bacterium]
MIRRTPKKRARRSDPWVALPAGARCVHPKMRCPSCDDPRCGHLQCPDCGLSWDDAAGM